MGKYHMVFLHLVEQKTSTYYTTFATHIGLHSAHWPPYIPTTLGNGLDLICKSYLDDGGRRYIQIGSDVIVDILNR
jgi:hypothetical protein